MQVNVMEINGNWDYGYVLDKHSKSSTFIGYDEQGKKQFDTIRTEIGEALFQLKYRSDFSKVVPLALEIKTRLNIIFSPVSLIIPIPPSKVRKIQPVTELAKETAKQLEKPFYSNLLVKVTPTPQMKDILLTEDKVSSLLDSFQVNDILPNGKYDILLVDDLYSSGSSLKAATEVLRKYSKIGKIFVVAISQTK